MSDTRLLEMTPAGQPTTSLLGTPYHLGANRRAMVSLGPVKLRNYCTFKCPFCYVQGPFPRYQQGASVQDIISWLLSQREHYDIVYISGDTDSFAPPRTQEAIALIDALRRVDCDVLFTTRHLFTSREQHGLAVLARHYRQSRRLLIGCTSVSQLHHPGLEPDPIAAPATRLEQVATLRDLGIRSVLAIRPFIPDIPAAEYAEIAERGARSADIVLGGDWYVDPAGVILSQTQRVLGMTRARPSRRAPLDFTDDATPWDFYVHDAAEAAVRAICAKYGRPFFMRSDPAIAYLRRAAT